MPGRVDAEIEKILPLLPLKDAANLTPERARAELTALAFVGPDLFRPEPRLRRLLGDRVELSAELRDPPAVVDVLGVDLDADDPVDRSVQLVDRDGAVRIREPPVELVRVDADA